MSIVWDYREPKYTLEMDILDEGSPCPECRNGVLAFFSKNCSCHVNAPCSSCTDAPLRCEGCKFETEDL
jgi:hypothetical protein